MLNPSFDIFVALAGSLQPVQEGAFVPDSFLAVESITEQETAKGHKPSTEATYHTQGKNLVVLTGPGGNQDCIWGVVR